MSMTDDEKEELQRQHHDKSTGFLRKIAAGKGKISGNFFYTGSTNPQTDQWVLITLSIRDKKGKKIKATGKALRKKAGTTRFNFGRITYIDGKIVFDIIGGNAPVSQLKKAAKSPDMVKQIRLLKKCFFRKWDETADPTHDLTAPSTPSPQTAEERRKDDEEEQAVVELEGSKELKSAIKQEKNLIARQEFFSLRIKKSKSIMKDSLKKNMDENSIKKELLQEQMKKLTQLFEGDISNKDTEIQATLTELVKLSQRGEVTEEEEAIQIDDISQVILTLTEFDGMQAIVTSAKYYQNRIEVLSKEVLDNTNDSKWLQENRNQMKSSLRETIDALDAEINTLKALSAQFETLKNTVTNP